MPQPFQWDLHICQVSEFDPDGFLLCQGDTWGEAGSDPFEVMSPGGTLFRPRDADSNTGQGTPMLTWFEGGKPALIPLLDTRVAPKLPHGPKGTFVCYGDTGKSQLPFASFDGDSGSWTCYVPYQDGAKAHVIAMNADTGAVQVIAGSGANVSLGSDGSATIVAGDLGASVTVWNGGKVTINGNTVVNGGATIGDPQAALAAAVGPLVIAYLNVLEAAISAALTSVGVGVACNGPGAATTFAAQVAAQSAAKAAISALKTMVA